MLPVIILLAIGIAYQQYNKPHRSVENETAIAIQAKQLFNDFYTNETSANSNYLNKVLEVTGIVVALNTNQDGAQIVLLETENPMFGISCTLEQSSDAIKMGDQVTIKGICTGYLSDVVVNRGVLVNP